MKTFLHAVLIYLGIFFSVSSAQGSTITAYFTDGEGDLSYDQYPGVGGGSGAGGWYTAWSTLTSSATITASVLSSSQLNSGGNYLHVVMQGTSSGTGTAAIYRQHDSSVVDLTQSLVYNFDFRADSLATNSYITFFSGTAAKVSTAGAGQTWGFTCANGQWQLSNGNLAGSTTTVYYSSAFSVNTNYHITVNVNPSAQSWNITITNLDTGVTVLTSSTLGFRYNVTTEGSYLEFTGYDSTSDTSDSVAFSIDNISIASIPEPTSVGLFFIGIGMIAGHFAWNRSKKYGTPVVFKLRS